MHGWTITEHDMKLETPFVACAEVTFVRGGKSRPYLVVLTKQGVAALVVTEDERVLLVRQLRFGTGTYHWELPQETLGNEESKDAVARLLKEELGIAESLSVEKVPFSIAAAPHRMTEMTDTYLVRISSYAPVSKPDEEEIDSVGIFSLQEIDRLIIGGEITEAVSIGVLQWFLSRSKH